MQGNPTNFGASIDRALELGSGGICDLYCSGKYRDALARLRVQHRMIFPPHLLEQSRKVVRVKQESLFRLSCTVVMVQRQTNE